MKAEEFDQAFDRGEDVSSALDLTAARRPGLEQRRVNVDFPVWMIESLDREARRLGLPASQSSRCGSPSTSNSGIQPPRYTATHAQAVVKTSRRARPSPIRPTPGWRPGRQPDQAAGAVSRNRAGTRRGSSPASTCPGPVPRPGCRSRSRPRNRPPGGSRIALLRRRVQPSTSSGPVDEVDLGPPTVSHAPP